MHTTLRIAVLLAIVMPALLLSQDNTSAPADKAQLQAKLTGPDIAAKLEALAEVESFLLSLPSLDKAQQDTWLPLLIGLLQDQDGSVSSQATELLKNLGKKFGAPVVDTLLAALQNPHAMTRYLSAEALGEIGDKRAIAPLLKLMLEDSDVYARGSAASALGNLRSIEAIEPLIALLQDQSVYRFARICAAEALGKLGDKLAIEPLIKALQDKEDYVRYAAAHALENYSDNIKVIESLVECVLQDRNVNLREISAYSLVKIGEKNPQINFQRYFATIESCLPQRVIAIASSPKTPVPDVALSLAGPDKIVFDGTAEYTILITNIGKTKLADAQIIFPVMLGFSYVSSSPQAIWNPVTQILIWSIPEIEPEANYKIILRLRAQDLFKFTHMVKLVWHQKETRARHHTQVLGCPVCLNRLHISTYDTDDPIRVGKTTVYVVEVRNNGLEKKDNVVLKNIISPNLQFLRATLDLPEAIKDKVISYTEVSPGQIIFDSVPSLYPGEKITYRILCLAVEPGSAKNIATVTYDRLFINITDEEGTGVYK